MALITYDNLNTTLNQILQKNGFENAEADLVAQLFSDSTLDGYHSHGVNRFVEFLNTIKNGHVNIEGRPIKELSLGSFERWDGQLGPGPLSAQICMGRAIELAKESGMGCVALKNGSHWMRGGSYGWQAANAGCIGICFTNTEPNMPSWGAKTANTGNNPMIVAVPNEDGHIVLDMSLSQFSYGKMWKYDLEGKELPFPGGYDEQGALSTNPKAIVGTRRVLPTGYWKGSGLSIMVDLMVTLLSSGRSTAKIGEMDAEVGLSQVFICFDASQMNEGKKHKELVDEIINHVKAATPEKEGQSIEYPGSQTLQRRAQYLAEGIPINDEVWNKVIELLK